LVVVAVVLMLLDYPVGPAAAVDLIIHLFLEVLQLLPINQEELEL
jgi:hypothetical protein